MVHGLIVCLECKVTIHGGNLLGGHNNKRHQDKERNQVYIGHEHQLDKRVCRKIRPATESELTEALGKMKKVA